MTATLISKRSFEGFTLLEVLISLGLIAIALLAVFRLQGQNLDLQSEAQFVTVARYLAQERISRIQAAESIEFGRRSGDFEEAFPRFRYEEEADESSDTEGIFNIKVRIFLEGGGSARDFTTRTLLFSDRQ